MPQPGVKEEILKELDRLSPAQQQRALEAVRALDLPLKGASIEDLLSLSGSLDEESAREMEEAVEAHCERIDPCGW